jgi:hypothetical protein
MRYVNIQFLDTMGVNEWIQLVLAIGSGRMVERLDNMIRRPPAQDVF